MGTSARSRRRPSAHARRCSRTYQGKWGWTRVFGRVVAGYLDANYEVFRDYDLIVPSPTFVGEGGRESDHIADILEWAQVEAFRPWPIASGLIVKTQATTKMVDATSWHVRRRIAALEVRPALETPWPHMIAGRRVLVFDDVFTGGNTLVEVAGKLRSAGALDVDELVLARQMWTP